MNDDFRARMERVEALVARMEASVDPAAVETARGFVGSVLALHGEGLARAIAIANGSEAGRALVGEMARDGLVGSMLLLHDLHPRDLETRAREALAKVRAMFGDAQIDLALSSDGALEVRVRGEPLAKVRLAVQEALASAAPDAASIAIDDGTLLPAFRLVRRAPEALRDVAAGRDVSERCERCAAPIDAEHAHLFDARARALVCACVTCARLADAPWRRVARHVERLDAFPFDAPPLGAAIDLAFFHRSASLGRAVAAYPSPGGAVESLLEEDEWRAIVACHPRLTRLADDVEALLVHRAFGARAAYVVSIDVCFHLTGVVGTHWQGMGGGPEVRPAIERFFAELAQ